MSADPRAARLRERLRGAEPVDEREQRSLEATVEALGRLPRPFDRDADPVHVTASAIVVGPRGVLLHRHKRLGLWLQPGGHIDAGEEPDEAARRETREETGVRSRHPAAGPALLHVDVHEVAADHTHLDVRYLLLGDDIDPRPEQGESPEAAWFGRERAEQIADPGLAGALRALRSLCADGSLQALGEDRALRALCTDSSLP